MGPYTFQVTMQVMEISPASSMLLGRPWIHTAGAVPPSLHQRVKYVVEGHVVTVKGEETDFVTKPAAFPYIEAAEEAIETSFQSLEIVNAIFVAEGSTMPTIQRCLKLRRW